MAEKNNKNNSTFAYHVNSHRFSTGHDILVEGTVCRAKRISIHSSY